MRVNVSLFLGATVAISCVNADFWVVEEYPGQLGELGGNKLLAIPGASFTCDKFIQGSWPTVDTFSSPYTVASGLCASPSDYDLYYEEDNIFTPGQHHWTMYEHNGDGSALGTCSDASGNLVCGSYNAVIASKFLQCHTALCGT